MKIKGVEDSSRDGFETSLYEKPFYLWSFVPDVVDLSMKGIKDFPPLAGGIKGGGEHCIRVLSF